MDAFTEIAKDESTRKPNWLELPIELTKNILWWNVCKDIQMRLAINMSNISPFPFDFRCLEKICRYAIDLGCDQVEDIDIELFGTDDFLNYMVGRASHLRRLQLFNCNEVSETVLIGSVENFSLLEELDISFNEFSDNSLEVIGRCCPLLKSLHFERVSYSGYDAAFSVGKTMPGLRHLSFSGIHFLDDNGLLAILNGCPLLESLDLRKYILPRLSQNWEKDAMSDSRIYDFQSSFLKMIWMLIMSIS
ncbi:F-box protein SKIP19 [Medicago truncatula]|uniref:F-box/LRR protein, putative n=2 Tax=Medicago truncatula TaxID=3880 RepID=A0A072UYT4_MEDTR|nr:F-box protein SKIP19 [Medicago truncatula]KEH34606.1 F-box/LRR protein, putative [Medicago truncatula]